MKKTRFAIIIVLCLSFLLQQNECYAKDIIEKLGGNYTTNLKFEDSYQRTIDFNDDVQVLYETLYNTGERHDAVGLRNTGGYNCS